MKKIDLGQTISILANLGVIAGRKRSRALLSQRQRPHDRARGNGPDLHGGHPDDGFEGEYFLGAGGRTYDVSPDGERFLMIKQVESQAAEQKIIVVQNWFEELKRLVPTE